VLSSALPTGVADFLRNGGLLYSERPAGLLRKPGCFTPKNAAIGKRVSNIPKKLGNTENRTLLTIGEKEGITTIAEIEKKVGISRSMIK